jgi:anti-sigma regulatory factor (Ser/Thr protein kinase)
MSVTTDRSPCGSHVVLFYDSDDAFGGAVGKYLVDGLCAGDAVVIVATPRHVEILARHVAQSGFDLEAARVAGQFQALDAGETLCKFLVDHRPQPELFNSVVGDLVRVAAEGNRRVRVYGEMVALLWDAGQVTAAMELESLWNGLGSRVPFSLFCAYPATTIGGDTQALEQLCGLHSAVVGTLPGSTSCPGVHVEVATREFGGALLDAGAARRFAIDALDRCGWHQIANDVALVVTELAANAVVHAHSSFTVTLSSNEDGVRVAVRDGSPLAPNLREPASMEVRGRGLRLVATLSASWGTDLEDDGKVVWAELVP